MASQPLDAEYDVLLECSGAAAALGSGMTALARSGRIVLIGMGADDVSVNVPLVQGRELTITGTFRYANTYPTAIALAASGKVDLKSIITGHYGLDEAEAALKVGREDPASVKPMVVP